MTRFDGKKVKHQSPSAALTAVRTPVKLPGLVVTANAVGRSALRRRSPSDGEAG
ncbi:MAG: hypothetical protein WHS90_07255 [Caldilinea sp.]|uniref:hypothetical protein n=1 Tax=Caldilinea sp. TaxID=2293560 RepID=UPI00309845B3